MTSSVRPPVPWAAIVPLESVDSSLIVGFSCSESIIDAWLHGPSRKDVKCGGCAVHVCVDALNDGLVGWYERRGFTRLPGKPRRLVCKMSSVKAMVQGMPEGYFVVAH